MQGWQAVPGQTLLVRLLDPVPWSVAWYDPMTGECLLQRKATVVGQADRVPPAAAAPSRFADQHDLLGADIPERFSATTQGARRDPAVRLAVLQRANGRCELCDTEGFRVDDGRLYAETHHGAAAGRTGGGSGVERRGALPDASTGRPITAAGGRR